MKNSLVRLVGFITPEMAATGITPDIYRTWVEEMNDPQYDPIERMYFTWAQKGAH